MNEFFGREFLREIHKQHGSKANAAKSLGISELTWIRLEKRESPRMLPAKLVEYAYKRGLEDAKQNYLAYAVFGLGRFIDYRIQEGMQAEALKPFMQAYLSLEALIQGRDAQDLDELLSQKVTDEPGLEEANRQVTPCWLPGCEKLRLHRQSLDTCLCI